MMAGALFSAPAIADVSDEEILDFYGKHVHARETGVYEIEGWFFFHQRSPLQEDSFGRARNLKTSFSAATTAVMDKIEELAEANPVPKPRLVVVLQARLAKMGSGEYATCRSFGRLQSRCLSQDADGDMFVYDLAVRRRDLESEAARGRFADRIETVGKNWRVVVKRGMKGKDAKDFIKRCGVVDVYPLSGKELERAGDIGASYKQCAVDLSCGLAAELPEQFKNESCDELKTLILGESKEPLRVQFEQSRDLIAFDAYLAETDEAARFKYLVEFLSHTPGSRLYWEQLGELCLSVGKYRLAVVSFRNALTLNRVRKIEYPLLGLAKSYRALGYRDLADVTASFVYGMTEDLSVQSAAEEVLKAE